MPVPGDFISDNEDENLGPPSSQRVGSVRHSTLSELLTVTTTTLQTPDPLSQPLEGIDQTQYSTPLTQNHPRVPTALTTLSNHPPPINMQSKWKPSPSLSGVDISPGSLSLQTNFHNPSILSQMHSIMDASDSNHHPLAVRSHIRALPSEDIPAGRTADSACFSPARKLPLITPLRGDEHIDTFVPRTKVEHCQASLGKDMQLEYDSLQQSVMSPSRIDLEYRREPVRTNDENSGELIPLLKKDSNLVSVNVEYPSLETPVPCQDIGRGEVVHDPSLQGLSFHSPLLLKLNIHSNSQSQFRVEFSPLDQQNNNFSTSFQFVPGPMVLLTEETPSRMRPEFESGKEAQTRGPAAIGTALPTRTELGQDSIQGSPKATSTEVQAWVNDSKQIKIEDLQRGVGCRKPPECPITHELDGKRPRPSEAGPVKKSKYPISLLPTVHPRFKPNNPSKYIDRQIPPDNYISDKSSGKKERWSVTAPDQEIKSFKSSPISIINPHCAYTLSATIDGQGPQVVRPFLEQDYSDLKPIQSVTSSEYLKFNGKGVKKADSEVQGHESPKRSSILPGQPLGKWLRNKMNTNTRGNTLLEGISTPGLQFKVPKPNPASKLKIRKQASGAYNTNGKQVLTVPSGKDQVSEASTVRELAVPSTKSSRPRSHTTSIPTQSLRNCATYPSIQPSRIPIRSRSSPTEYSKKVLGISSRQNPPLPSMRSSDQCFHAPNEIENYVDEDDDGGIKNSRTWHTFSSSPWRRRSKREVDSGSLRVKHLRQLYLSKVCQSSGGISTDPVVNVCEQSDDQHDCFL